MTVGCGGCRGLGSHRLNCPHHPDYHPWRQLAEAAEDIGDTIGSNDPGLANQAYALGAAIRKAMPDHTFPTYTIKPSDIRGNEL